MAVNKEQATGQDTSAGSDRSKPREFHGTTGIQIDPFFQVPLYTQDFSRGEIQLPILIKDATAVYCQFIAPRSKVAELLQGKPLDPAFTLGSRALVGLTIHANHQSTVGPHVNMELVIPVTRQNGFKRLSSWQEIRMSSDRRHMGFFVIDSAQDSPVMLSAGRDVWGYPGFMAQLFTGFKGAQLFAECNDFDGRKGIARLTGFGPRLFRIPSIDLTLFSLKGNELPRSLVNTRGSFHLHWPLGFRLQVGDSDHPMAQRLRYLGLDNARPLAVLSCDDYQARMNAGVTVDILCN